MLVKDYIAYLEKQNTDCLFGDGLHERLERINASYGDTGTSMVILETRLDVPEKNCDYSICVASEDENVCEYWHELDYDAVTAEGIVPSMYMDASFLVPGMDMDKAEAFIDGRVGKFAGEERTAKLKPQLLKVLKVLEGKCRSLYQLGIMTSRNENSSMRVFPENLSPENAVRMLEELGWDGDIGKLEAFLSEIMAYGRHRVLKVDFDIYEDRISSKIGVNFDPDTFDRDRLTNWLQYLISENLCLNEKAQALLQWTYTPPQYRPFIINDLIHFKFVFDHGRKAAKAYLRQGTEVCRSFDMFFRPVQMNLELTDRCPLHCRQCYCDLNHGRDMDFETALYWIREAGREKVQSVNLSGGETILYPGLADLVRECRKYGMEPNAAFSGWGLTEEKILELIDAGIGGIYISLNGSTEEINSRTRDGYPYAVKALETLRETGFDRTSVNWVMHRSNADDFENVIALCERYGVAEIAVMAFKPDAAHELPDEPTSEQLRKTAGIIKGYKGKLKIGVESCFSQMRALIGQGFLMNSNRGVARGCGAGRDGISVSADGKLSPCRHLEFYEDDRTIGEYWDKSEVLKELRTMEERMDENCAKCRYRKNCLPCAAVNVKLHGYIGMGHESCKLSEGGK